MSAEKIIPGGCAAGQPAPRTRTHSFTPSHGLGGCHAVSRQKQNIPEGCAAGKPAPRTRTHSFTPSHGLGGCHAFSRQKQNIPGGCTAGKPAPRTRTHSFTPSHGLGGCHAVSRQKENLSRGLRSRQAGSAHPDAFIHPKSRTRGLPDRKSTRLNSSHSGESRMPSSA